MLQPPAIKFARNGPMELAFQVAGEGPPDLVYVAGAYAMTLQWQEHAYARGLRRLASFSRLVTFDQRGMGFSDPVDAVAPPSLDDLVADLEEVIAAAGVADPVLFGAHNGGAVAAAYAARHPVQRLVVCNSWARLKQASDYPIGFSDEVMARLEDRYRENWGEGRISRYYAKSRPDLLNQPQLELESTSRSQALALYYVNRDYDIRAVLPSITAPTLVLHLEDDRMVPPRFGRYFAEQIPGAKFALVPGDDHSFMRNNADEVIDIVELFVTGTRGVFVDRMTTTMLFTDIVDSTALAASLGDERWSALIDQHNERFRTRVLERGGFEVKGTGDGFLVAFEEPDAAVRCALDAIESIAGLGLELRAGVHIGEVSRMGSRDLSGLAVHFAQRLCDRAESGQVLVSAAVRDECRGAALHFEDRGKAQLKGIPGEWEVLEARL
jgi:class 3 adenylate cyclase/alpha-beta hydrolase superfamily lysophospholipase